MSLGFLKDVNVEYQFYVHSDMFLVGKLNQIYYILLREKNNNDSENKDEQKSIKCNATTKTNEQPPPKKNYQQKTNSYVLVDIYYLFNKW